MNIDGFIAMLQKLPPDAVALDAEYSIFDHAERPFLDDHLAQYDGWRLSTIRLVAPPVKADPVAWKPFLLWVKHPCAPREESISLDLYRFTYEGGAQPAYHIELHSTKGMEYLVEACNTRQVLQFGLARDGVGRLFVGKVTKWNAEVGLQEIGLLTFSVSAPRYEEYDLSGMEAQ